MLEWLKRHAWKACVPQKGIASSNLALSAKSRRFCVGYFCFKRDTSQSFSIRYSRNKSISSFVRGSTSGECLVVAQFKTN